MNRKNLAPRSLFKAESFGFSQGVLVEEGKKQLFISGQLAADMDGNFLSKADFKEQCRKAFEGIDAVLKEAGATRHNIVKITAFVTELQRNLETFVELSKEFFQGDFSASTLIEVKGLAFLDQLVEIEAIAIM
ncbi:MAG: RidA family protein [Thaumarchaeota archaeon]|nr:RidA family protein [Nitrososphaerota archaeon]